MSGEFGNIITKNIENKQWIRILSKNILKNKKEYSWRIKILNSKNKDIMVGVAQIEPKIVVHNLIYNNAMPLIEGKFIEQKSFIILDKLSCFKKSN